MLRDITIGQHFPGTSLVHRFDPRMKLVLTIVYIVLLFAASNPLGLPLSNPTPESRILHSIRRSTAGDIRPFFRSRLFVN